MKKYLLVLLLIIFSFGLVFASGGKKAEEKTITLWHVDLGNIKELNEAAVKRYNEEYPEITVEISPFQNDPYKTKLLLAMGSENPPDIFVTTGAGVLGDYLRAGKIREITDMMDRDNYKDRFVSLTGVTFDGKIYGVPAGDVAIAVVYYNKEIFRKHNLSIPKDDEDFVELINDLQNLGYVPIALANKTKWPGSMPYMYMVDRLGGPEPFRKAANREPGGTFQHPVYEKAGDMLQNLVKMGAFSEGYNGLDWDTGQSRALMYSGIAAMEVMGTFNNKIISAENPEFYENNLDFFPFPAIKGGKGDPNAVVGTVGDYVYSISTDCENPEDAFRVLQYLIDDESVKLRAETGGHPPVKGFKSQDPLVQKVIDLVENAPYHQLWYDQYLPTELGEVHKNTCQALLGLEMTPEEVNKEMDEAVAKFYEK